MKKIEKNYLFAEDLNALYEEGYRFTVDGDITYLSTYDPWSGMPNVKNNTYAFVDREEAEAFAQTQNGAFCLDHPIVREIPKHTFTNEELDAIYKAEKAERKAKREAKEAEKAERAGMSVEEFRKSEARKRNIRKAEREIEELEKTLRAKRAYLAKLKREA